MDALGSWSIPQRVPVSNFRNQQQPAPPVRQTVEYANHKQQSTEAYYTPEQAYHRDIYSSGRSVPEQQNQNPIYNNIRVDPNLQNANAHAQNSHTIQQHPRAMQMQPLSHLANDQQALVNGEGLRQRKPSHNVQQQQQSLQHSRTFKPPSWDQNSAPVPALDTRVPQTDKPSSINGFSATRLQLSPQNYQLQPPNHTDTQIPSGPYRQTNIEKNARQSSDQLANLQVQVNERDRPAHLAMNGQIGSTAGQQGHPKQVPSLDSGLTIQVPTSSSETAASSTPLSSAFRPQHNPSQAEVNMNGMTNHGQLFDLSRTVERLAKAQADMFAFLQAEMSRRKTWEEQCLHEIRRRNSHSDSLSTHGSSAHTGSRNSVSTGAPGTVTSNNGPMALSLNLPFNQTNGNNMAISMANEIHHDFMQRATGMTPNGNATYSHPVSNSHTPSTIMPSSLMASVGNFSTTAATQSHVNGTSFPLPMNGGLSNGKVPIASDDKGSDALAQPPPPTNHVSTLGVPTEPIGNEESAQSVPVGTDSETPTKAEEAPKQRKRPRTDSNIDSERAGKRFAVNERGIVYMAGGSTKSTQTPTKIQSIVRKTLYASMGVPADLEGVAMPIYVQDMAPPDGSDEWKFGNLRFDWNSTMRRCVHNKKMRDIVLEHIISLRGEYSEIADSEFVQARLEQAFDQAFATWKGKYLGKRSGGIRRTTTVKKPTQEEVPTPTQLPDALV